MAKKGAKSAIERKRDAAIEKIGDYRNFLKGSLLETLTRCGNPNCRCARGQRHEVLHLSYSTKGKTKRVYIPRSQAKTVKARIKNRKKILDLLEKILDLNLQLLKEERGKKNKTS